jgi:glutaredoxin 3
MTTAVRAKKMRGEMRRWCGGAPRLGAKVILDIIGNIIEFYFLIPSFLAPNIELKLRRTNNSAPQKRRDNELHHRLSLNIQLKGIHSLSIMGRITVFSSDGCTYCRQVRAALTAREIPFTDINISHYPQKRADMLALTDRYTVPQVFFNENHIGGADETIALLNEWDEELKGGSTTAKDRYVETIEAEAGPYDVRLAKPTGPPAIQYMNLTVSRPKEITEVNGKHFTTLQLTKELIKKMPRKDLSTFGFGVVHKNSFLGSDAVS